MYTTLTKCCAEALIRTPENTCVMLWRNYSFKTKFELTSGLSVPVYQIDPDFKYE